MDLYKQLLTLCLLLYTEAQKKGVPKRRPPKTTTKAVTAQMSEPKTWNKPFPPLLNLTAEDLDVPSFIFDGVDYDLLPEEIAKRHKNCNAEFIRCSRAVTYHNPVCGYDLHEKEYYEFASYCELEFQNCEDWRVKERRYHVMGEGHKCTYTRRLFTGSSLINIMRFIKKFK